MSFLLSWVPLAELMMSSSLCNLHWPQVRSTLPVFSGFLSYFDRVLLLPPSSRLGIHQLSLWEAETLMTSCAGCMTSSRKLSINSCAQKRNGNARVWTLNLEPDQIVWYDALDRLTTTARLWAVIFKLRSVIWQSTWLVFLKLVLLKNLIENQIVFTINS